MATAVERRNAMAVLANIKLELTQTELTLTASDLEVELRSTLALPAGACVEPGATTLPAKKLQDIVKSLPANQSLTLALKSGEKCQITSGKSRFTLGTLPATDFPSMGEPTGATMVTVSRHDLKELIGRTGFAMAVQDVRFYLTGMLFEIESDELRCVATDGHRLAFGRVKTAQNLPQNLQAVVPRKAVGELSRLLGNEEGDLNLTIGTEFIQAELDVSDKVGEGQSLSVLFTSRLIDGKYPDYLRVMMQQTTKSAQIDRDLLKQVLSRVSILSHERSRGVIFDFQDGGILQVRANNAEQDEAVEDISVAFDGQPIEVSFNASYLMDVVNVFDGPLHLNMSEANASVLVNAGEDASFQYVIMPMRL